MKNKVGYLFIVPGIIVMALTFWLVRAVNKDDSQPVADEHISQSENATPSPVTELELGQKVSVNYKKGDQFEVKSYKVTEGQKVQIRIASDVQDEIHFHGYDISKDIEPGKEVLIEFTANQTGRFEFELENSGVTLGYIEVYPK